MLEHMKNYFLCLLLGIVQLISKAQNPEGVFHDSLPQLPIRKSVVGFQLGGNFSGFYDGATFNSRHLIADGQGIRMGILIHHQISRTIGFVPSAELILNNSKLFVEDNEQVLHEKSLVPMNMQFSGLCKWVLPSDSWAPFIQAGPAMRVPVFQKEISSHQHDFHSDLAADLGFGFEKKCGNLFIGPTIRYTHGFYNISNSPDISPIVHDQLSLTIVVRG